MAWKKGMVKRVRVCSYDCDNNRQGEAGRKARVTGGRGGVRQ